MSVVDDVNKAASGGEHIDYDKLTEEQKRKILAGEKIIENPANAARLAGSDSKTLGDISAESTTTPSDKFVPEKTPQVKSGSVGPSSEVPQQWDSNVPKDGVDKQGENIRKKEPQSKNKGVGPSSEVPQQSDKGKDGI
jgi:hypothetical protein